MLLSCILQSFQLKIDPQMHPETVTDKLGQRHTAIAQPTMQTHPPTFQLIFRSHLHHLSISNSLREVSPSHKNEQEDSTLVIQRKNPYLLFFENSPSRHCHRESCSKLGTCSCLKSSHYYFCPRCVDFDKTIINTTFLFKHSFMLNKVSHILRYPLQRSAGSRKWLLPPSSVLKDAH